MTTNTKPFGDTSALQPHQQRVVNERQDRIL